jgi:hypothetical protein
LERDVNGVLFNHLPMGSHHSNGAHFVMADAAVVFISDSIDFPTYQYLGTCNGGEVASLP